MVALLRQGSFSSLIPFTVEVPCVTICVWFCPLKYNSAGCLPINSMPSLLSALEWHSGLREEVEEIVGCTSEAIVSCCCAVATQARVFRLVAAT